MADYSAAFAAIDRCHGETSVDGATDTDWPSIETVLREYADTQHVDWEEFFGEALANYRAIADQAQDQSGYRPTFNFSVLQGDPGTVQVRWN